jgi:RecA/RadA recombinase
MSHVTMAASPRLLDALTTLESIQSLHLGSGARLGDPSATPQGLPTGMPALDAALPDGGLPRGVIELCGPSGMGRVTQVALQTCVAAQHRSDWGSAGAGSAGPGSADPGSADPGSADPGSAGATCSVDERRWCAWVDASHSLYAPGLARAGIDLDRLLVVRPEPADIARVTVRLVNSRVFSVVVVDRAGVPGARLPSSRETGTRWSTVVRRLALAATEADTTILLLSSTAAAQRETLPTAMRLELSQPAPDRLRLAIAKDKRGRLRAPQTLPFSGLALSALVG